MKRPRPPIQKLKANAPGAWNRRAFISTTAAAAAGTTWLGGEFADSSATAARGSGSRRRRIAMLVTEVRKYSHAQHFVDRFTEGYGWQGRYHRPPFEFAGLYVDQFPEGDLSRDRARRHHLAIYPTVEEALTLGGSNLAVDGVIIIAEHGLYPRTEQGQTLYPRHALFQRTVNVFEGSGRAVPVFNDKHLSTDWHECVAMVEASRRLGFPFLAGSSLPVTWRIPGLEIPWHTPMTESVCVGYGGLDSYDIHGLETAQCMSERRAGGESGVQSVQAVRGQRVWEMIEQRKQTQQLFSAALARSFTCRGRGPVACLPPTLEWLRQQRAQVVAYFYEHLDGFRTALFLLNGLLSDFNYAGMERGTGRIHSCQMYLPMPPALSTLADFFNPLSHHIERMIDEGKAPYPVERTLLTSGMTLTALESLYRGQILLPTPELKVAYEAPQESLYWKA